MNAIIMAGGKGTRIASVRNDVPKPMIEICNKPILQYQIENLRAYGITNITLVIGHLGNIIKEYFKDGSDYGVNISYFEEITPLGTAGALFKMNLPEDFVLLCGDIIIDIDFRRFISFHREHKAWASLATHPNGHPYDSSIVITEILPPKKPGGLPVETGRVTKWLTKEDGRTYYKNRVNAGVEIISPRLIKTAKEEYTPWCPENPEKVDLDRDILKRYIKSGKIFAYDTTEYIKDMGTPERFYEAEQDIRSGKVHKKNLSQKQKAFFLDRDGTINKLNGFITTPDQFELIDGVAEAIKMINKEGYLVIVITNQPIIARGDCSFEALETIHKKMETKLGEHGAYIDAIYYCPHHPDKGFPGERIEYKCNCSCRKPNPGLLLKAALDYNIDLSQSYMIGDEEKDMVAGKSAGCKTIIVKDTHNFSLLNAVQKIFNNN